MVVCGAGLFACKREEPSASVARATQAGVVDSIFPTSEEIRRFKERRNGVAADVLTGGAPTRDELVERLVRALGGRDVPALSRLVITDGEFIDLYYPTSIYAGPPYKQSPEIVWLLRTQASDKGMTRALARLGGRKASGVRYKCESAAVVQGRNRIWNDCRVSNYPGLPDGFRLFGPIIERDGIFKFYSYANDF